jgi:RHS repeat-associated protein
MVDRPWCLCGRCRSGVWERLAGLGLRRLARDPMSRVTRRLARRAARAVLLALVVWLPLSAAAPAAAAAGPRWPSVSLGGLRVWLAGPGRLPPVPRQETGIAPGRQHQVPAAVTRAVAHAAGRAPGRGLGQLPAYAPHGPAGKPFVTGPDVGNGSASFSPATSKLVAGASTATSDLYRNADGSYTRLVYTAPVNYQAASGSWRRIDASVVAAAGGRWRERANSLGVSFAPAAGDPALASLDLGRGRSVSLSLAGAAPAPGTLAGGVAGATVTYAGALPGTGVALAATATGLRVMLRLSAPSSAADWVFPLRLAGLTPQPGSSGTVDFVDAAGQATAVLAPAQLADSKISPVTGLPALSSPVTYKLVTYHGQPALEVVADAAWLADPARVFPATVNLELGLPAAGAGQAATQAVSGSPGVLAGGPVLAAGSFDAGKDSAAAVLSFPAVPAFPGARGGDRLTSASLHVFGAFAGSCAAPPLRVSVLGKAAAGSGASSPGRAAPGPGSGPGQQAWVPAASLPAGTGACARPAGAAASGAATPGATVGSTPAAGPGGAVALVPGAAGAAGGSWLSVALPAGGAAASAALAGTTVAVSAAAAGGARWQLFGSAVSQVPPFLELTATADTPPQIDSSYPPDNYNATSLTTELQAIGHDPDGHSVQYVFTAYSSSGTQLATSGLISVGDWSVPAGKLAWNQSYYWIVQDYDGTYYSAAPQINYFSTPVPQPLITSGLSQNTGGQGFSPAAGNYTHAATDAQVDVVGPALSIERDYNSLDPRSAGAFGAAWSSILDMRAEPGLNDSSGNPATIVVTYPDGQQVAFGKNASGSFTAPPGRYATLATVSGGYTLTDKNDTVYTFTQSLGSAAYGITSVADALGHQLTFTWTSGQITQITSAVSGRSLHITWSTPAGAAHPHAATVYTDPVTPGNGSTALTWQYSYNGDQLTQVCPPASSSACTKYSYTAGSDYQSAVLDSGPHSYWRLGEASGTTAASSQLANEGTDNGSYSGVTLGQPGPLPGSSATSASFDGSSSYVTLPNNDLAFGATYQSVSLWFKTSTPNGVLLSSQASPISAGTVNTSYVPNLYVGSDGKLVGEFWQASVPMQTPGAVTDNKWHLVTMTAVGNAETLYLDRAPVATASAKLANPTEKYNYVGTGFIGGGWPDEPHQNQTGTAYATYYKGQVSDVGFWDRPLTSAEIGAMYSAGTGNASLLTQLTRPTGSVYSQVSYNGVTSAVTSMTDDRGGTWQLAGPVDTGSSQVYVSSVLGAAPADYYRLADTGTNQAVNQVLGGDAYYNNVTQGVAGPFADATADSFDGSSSYLSLPSGLLNNGASQSVSLWFKTSATGGVLLSAQASPISAGTVTSSYVPSLYVGSDGKLVGEFWHASGQMLTSRSVADGKWHLATMTTTGTSESLYLDGALAATASATALNPGLQYDYVGTGFLGGGWPDEPHQNQTGTAYATYFNGSIGDVAMYGSALSAAQVTAQYTASKYSSGLTPVQTATVTDPGGKTLTYAMDPLNGDRMLAQTDGLGNTTEFGYDTSGFLYDTIDPNGAETITGHDVRGNMVSQTTCQDQVGDVCSTAYYSYYPNDTSSQLTPDPRNDLLLTERGPGSASATDNTYLTSYGYDTKGQLTSQTSPPVTGFPNGRVTTTTYTDGTTDKAVDSGYAPAGLPDQETTPGGATTTTQYYANGDVAQVTDADGLVTKYTYDGVARVATKTVVSDSFPAGLTTSYGYDQMGEVTTETDPPVTDRVTTAVHTAQITTTYDADGDVTAQTVTDTTGGDASRTVSQVYNSHDQLLTSTDAAGAKTAYTYDAYGNKATETDPAGNVTAYVYDADGHLLTVTLQNYTGDPVNPSPPVNLVESSRAYDPAGRLASVTDSMGWMTSYAYTDDGLLATVTRSDPGTGASFTEEANTYDAAGRMISQVTGNGTTTTNYTLDAADRVTSEVLDPGAAPHLNRTTTNVYSPDDRVLNETVTNPNAGPPAQMTDYTYDPMGNQTSQTVHADTSGMAGRWRLDQTSGTSVPDASGNGNTATASDVTWSGGAASFPAASGQGITTQGPVLNTAGSFTVSAWANMASGINADGGVVSEHSTSMDGFELEYDSTTGNWAFGRADADTNSANWLAAESASAAQAGTWTHLVGTYDASTGTLTLYVNGVQSGTTATDTTPFAATGPLAIGQAKWQGSLADWFDGSISDVQAYQWALSPSEISALYQNGRNGSALPANKLTTTWTLDQRGLPTSMTDPNRNVTHYSYDEAGNLAVTTEPTVTTQVYGGSATPTVPVTMDGYNTFGEKVESSDANGNVTRTAYDAAGRPVSQTAPPYTPPGSSTPITAVSSTVYNGLGQVTKASDPLGNSTSYTYDQIGDAATVTAPDTGVTHYTYDTNGDQLSATGPTGAVTQATYDYRGRTLTATQVERYPSAAAYTTTNVYSDDAGGGGWLASQTSPQGVKTSYAYNPAGEARSVTDGAGNTTQYAYDAAGRLTATTAPDGTSTTTTFDEAGRAVGQADLSASGTVLRSASAVYDNTGNVTASTDYRGNTTTFGYDATGLVTSETQPVTASSSITTSLGYDAAGNRTLYTDGNRNNWWDTYNSWNLPESRVEPPTTAFPSAGQGTFRTAYDANRRPVSVSEPGGVSVSSSYDSVGRLAGQAGTGAEAVTAARSFGYDLAGNMTSASAPGGTDTFGYNDRGLLLSASGPSGSSSFSYNGDGQVSSASDAAGTTSYSYDNAGRLATLADPLTGTTATYSYTPQSQVSQISYGAGNDTRTFGYNGLHQLVSDALTGPSGQPVASVGYGYDLNGNLTSKTTAGFAGSSSNTYGYDEANRLTSWTSGTTTTNYAYDGAGNRTKAGSVTYAYDARDQLTSDSSGNTYSYTARGTLAQATGPGGTTTYASDAFGQPVTQGGQSYAYDALGRVVTASGTSAASFAYSGTGNVIASDGTWKYAWDPSGTQLAAVGPAGGGAGSLAFTDAHTDVTGTFTPNGTSLAGSASYDPFGQVTASAGLAGELGYQSGWTDPAAGLVHMGARWYGPGTGQFTTRDTTQVDPVPDPAAANPFAYAADNPMTGTDPTGHMLMAPTDSGTWHPPPRPRPAPPVSSSCGLFCWVPSGVRHAVSSGYHHTVNAARRAGSAVSRLYHRAARVVVSAAQSGLRELAEIRAAAARAEVAALRAAGHAVRDVAAAVSDAAAYGVHAAADVGGMVVSAGAAVAHHVARWAVHHYQAAVHLVRSAVHVVARAATATVSFVKHHAAAIASIVVSVAVFAGCEAVLTGISGGALSVPGAVACGALAGAAGNAVGYGITAAQTGKFSLSGLAGSVDSGAVSGALGGFLGGAGGKVIGMAGRAVADGLLSGGAATAATREATATAAGGLTTTAAQDATSTITAEARSAAESCLTGGQSFTADTKVLTAGGALVAISSLHKGEKVLATNVKTGKTTAETVAAVLVRHDTDRYDLNVKTARATAVIGTTRSHLFWNQTTGRWVKAAALKHGSYLRTARGDAIMVLGGRDSKIRSGWMWDLTIPGDHDFYIQAASAVVLVHNIVCRVLPSTSTAKYIALGTRREIQIVRDWEDADHEVLTLPAAGEPGGWSPARNDEWVDGAIAKRQSAYLTSRLTDENIFSDEFPDNAGTTVFGREVFRLLDAGYSISKDEQYMHPPDR